MVTREEEYKDRIKIFYEEEKVEDLKHFLVNLSNSGNEPIRPQDYETPLEVSLAEGSRVYHCEVVATVPHEVELPVEVSGAKVTLGKRLLNPGDRISLGVLATSSKDNVFVNARIAGVREIDKEEIVTTWGRGQRYLLIYGVLLSTAYAVSVIYSLFVGGGSLYSGWRLGLDSLLIIYMTLFILAFWKELREW